MHDAILALFGLNPNASKVKYKDWTSLQWSLSYEMSPKIVRALLTAHPTLGISTDSDLRTPLHVRMTMGANVDSIPIIFNAHPEAAGISDHGDWVPLRHGIRNKAPEASILLVQRFSPELPRADRKFKKPYEC